MKQVNKLPDTKEELQKVLRDAERRMRDATKQEYLYCKGIVKLHVSAEVIYVEKEIEKIKRKLRKVIRETYKKSQTNIMEML